MVGNLASKQAGANDNTVLDDVIGSSTDTEMLKWVPPSCQQKLDSRKTHFMKRKGDTIDALQI